MDNVFQRLRELDISYERYDHPPVHSVEEAGEYHDEIPGVHTKNLFLRNKKGNAHYLVVADAYADVDLGALAGDLGESRLSLASERRMDIYLGVTPGSVSPFGLMNDEDNEVVALIDETLLDGERAAFHPNDNRATIVISTQDFKKYLDHIGNEARYVSF